jgi:flagellar hook-basal body complex protein FliE
MNISGISSMNNIDQVLANASNLTGPTVERPDQSAQDGGNAFAQLLADLGNSSKSADGALNDLATGGTADLHDVVLSTQFESLAFDLAVQVRNRLVDMYSEVFRMQI